MEKERFSQYPLSSEILKAIELLHYESPTKVQEQLIPALLEHKDAIVKSRTGSGKTAAFAIPVCEMVSWEENKPQALVIAPTRELALQIKEDVFNLGRFKRLKVTALYGKSPFYGQEKELKQKTHIVVGTPGRILDHLDQETFDPSNIKTLILDEADEMLDMGFIEQIRDILSHLPKDRVTVLLSATMPGDIEKLCRTYMNQPVRIETEEHDSTGDRILQEQYQVAPEDKLSLLKELTIAENPDSCIIFCNTKVMVDEVFIELDELKYSCERLHGGMEQQDRLSVINHFKKGAFRYLIATDVAARGIDIDSISLVINYDVPQDGESYIHRIGRTGRVTREGRAITLVTPDDTRYLQDILNYTGKEIPLRERPSEELVNSGRQGFNEKNNSRPEAKESKGAQLSREILKLHINAGKKTKMRPVDVVGTLCNIEGINAQDIGIIQILDVSTFVEILNNKGELALRELQQKPIKGRLRKVSRVD